MPKSEKSVGQFWLDLFQASCDLHSMEPLKNEEDDSIPLNDYLKPKFKLSLGDLSLRQVKSSVQFLNLKKCYEKVQKRQDGKSTQRPTNCTIRMSAKFDAAWGPCDIDVYVQRHTDSAKLCGDFNGRVKLEVIIEEKRDNTVNFSVDLDSVYKANVDTPVYKLSTVDPLRRNRFILIICFTSTKLDKHQYFTSPIFLIRSRRPSKTSSSEATPTEPGADKQITIEDLFEKS